MISDLRLPDGNGIDLLRWMRKEGMMQPFIIMTDYAEVHTAVESMKLGSLDYIPKQLVEDRLVPLLRTILKERNIGRSRMPLFSRDGISVPVWRGVASVVFPVRGCPPRPRTAYRLPPHGNNLSLCCPHP